MSRRKYPPIVNAWRRNWEQVIPFFAFAPEIRKIVYTTNAIESLHMQVRKVIKNRGHFPNDDAACKLIYLALRNITRDWKMPPREWKAAMTQFAVAFPRQCAEATNAVAVRHLIGLDEQGTIVLRDKLARGRIGRRLANASPCLIGIEAGMATHYVARELVALGHDVRQTKPFRQCHKNDFRDACAVAEAVLRPSTRCVAVKTKTDDQLDPQALHRVRSRLVGQRAAVINP